MFLAHVDVQRSSNDEWALEINIADVCDLEVAIRCFSVDDGVFQNETRPIVDVGVSGRLQDRGLRNVFNMTEID